MSIASRLPRRLLTLVTVTACAAAGALAVGSPASAAAPVAQVQAAEALASGPPPVEQSDPTKVVSADALPTVQLDNGVAWSQVVVGNQVYVAGSFSNARPSGAAAGTSLIPRSNLLAYNITTGVLTTSFAPQLNAQARVVAKSPDGSRIYVGGDFGSADGQTRYKVAAYSTATGQLVATFKPVIGGSFVNSIAVTDSAVYVGGRFTAANGVSRGNLAAYSTSGALLNWAPTTDLQVDAMVMTPDNSKVIVGGRFGKVNGVTQRGLVALDATTGAILPWDAPNYIKNGVSTGSGAGQAGIYSLSTDGTSILGTGWGFSTVAAGNLEGAFSANPDTGVLNWIENCHGDSYSNYSTGSTVYVLSHAHFCGSQGGTPESDPRATNTRHAMAWTAAAKGTAAHDPYAGGTYFDWFGTPAPAIINWFPDFYTGKFTGQGQAAWSVNGNASYIVLGGEFPGVNGQPQYGLTRFAVKGSSPKAQGPRVSGTDWVPSVRSQFAGSARITFASNFDRDDLNLTYRVIRNGNTTTPVKVVQGSSTFWNRPNIVVDDKGLTAGATYNYRVTATDGDGNTVTSSTVTVVISNTPVSAYAQRVLDDGASSFWRLDEASGSTVDDWAGATTVTAGSGVSRGTAGAIIGDADTASTFDGSGNGIAVGSGPATAPSTFTAALWFKTTTTSGGKLIGYGNAASGNSSGYDRHVYMTNSGQIYFGVYPGGIRTVNSSASYNDGQWHQVVASLGAGVMTLSIDGRKIGSRADAGEGQPFDGFWRIGGDNLGAWPAQPSSSNFAGAIDDVAIYPTALSATTIADQYRLSGRTLDLPSRPTDTYGAAVFDDDPSLYWRLGEATGTSAKDSGLYDNPGRYFGPLTLGSPGALTNNSNTSINMSGGQTNVVATKATDNPTVYSEEAWFKTGTSVGGRIIGFGNSGTAAFSSSYDRHVYMEDSGQLTFGAYTGQLNTVTSPASYNNSVWHHVVATQSSAGMRLYVDGELVGSNSVSGAEGYTGYWRVGADNAWGGTSRNFDGYIDEAAVYSTALSPTQIADHYRIGSATVPNELPTASFTSTKADLTVSVDGSASADPDGTIASYSWNWGDGSPAGSGATASHPYAAAGDYTLTLTVTDNRGGTNSTSSTVTVVAPNQLPTARFTSTKSNLSVSVDGSTSSDPDGSIASYSWNWGDQSAAGTGATDTHAYAAAGTYTIILTVTDSRGGTATTSADVTVTGPPNQLPTASFTVSKDDLMITVNGSTSTDTDGAIASYSWNWGDGSPAGTGSTASHTYAAAGSYDVVLTVTDNRGGEGTSTKSVTVTAAPVNQAPVAAFTATPSDLLVSFNGSGSSDSDGTVVSYSWNWGDSTLAGTGATTSHQYSVAGSYTVTLTVTDNDGATNAVSKSVTVTAPAGPVTYATDTFGRTAATGWGSAEVGGTWTTTGSAGLYSVGGGVGSMLMSKAGQGPTATLAGVSAADVDLTATVSLDKVPDGSGMSTSFVTRKTAGGAYSLALAWKTTGVVMTLRRLVNGTETTLTTNTITGVTGADSLRVRFQVSGSGTTTLQGKVWKATNTEPSVWTRTVTDSTAGLQSAGSVSLQSYLSGTTTNFPVVARFDDLAVRSPAGQ